jgi:ankyrin repeat protein
VKFLLNAKNVNSSLSDNKTVLMVATRYSPDLIKYLLNLGADPNKVSNNGMNALLHAAMCCNTEVIDEVCM